jgi:hypothetical protein
VTTVALALMVVSLTGRLVLFAVVAGLVLALVLDMLERGGRYMARQVRALCVALALRWG